MSDTDSLTYIPKTVPYDECRKFYDCEKNAKECPSYKEYIDSQVDGHAGTTSDSKASSAAQAQIQQLQQMAVCIEKFQAQGNKAIESTSKYQRAAFLLSTLWNTTDTIKISFSPVPGDYPGEQPQWDGKVIQPPSQAKVSPPATDAASCSSSDDCASTGGSCVSGKCVANVMPKWYTRDLVYTNMKPGATLSAEDEKLEAEVRAMDPIEAIKKIVSERIQPLLGLKLEYVDADGDIRISLDNQKGSWSYVGTQSKSIAVNEPTMNFGWLDVATIIHEFCHALGMIHEHQNPFGKGIDWNLKKVFAWTNATQGWDMYTTCQNITKRYNMELVNGSDYDPESIMLYSYPAELTNNRQATYRNVALSPYDRLWLSSIYPKDGKPRSFPSRLQASANQMLQDEKRKKIVKYSMMGLGGALMVGGLAYWYLRNQKKGGRKKSKK
jgi:hypothetical protein